MRRDTNSQTTGLNGQYPSSNSGICYSYSIDSLDSKNCFKILVFICDRTIVLQWISHLVASRIAINTWWASLVPINTAAINKTWFLVNSQQHRNTNSKASTTSSIKLPEYIDKYKSPKSTGQWAEVNNN